MSESVWDTIQKTAQDTGTSVAEVCRQQPELYRRYLHEQGVTVVAPPIPIRKTGIDGTPSSSCVETRLILAYAEPLIRQGVPPGEAIERTIRAHPGWYQDHRRAMPGRDHG